MKKIKCDKCSNIIDMGTKGNYYTIENEKSKRSGEINLCEKCGNILLLAQNKLNEAKKIKKEYFFDVAKKVWKI